MKVADKRKVVFYLFLLICLSAISAIAAFKIWPREPFVPETVFIGAGTDKILVFVHGVVGDSRQTFTNNTSGAFWPQLVADDPDMRGFDVLSVSFDAGLESKLSIEQIATILRATLEDKGIFDEYNEIYFVAHSMGGLIVKRLLLDLWQARSPVVEQQISGLVFISTPAKGAEAADYLNVINAIGMRPLVDLRTYGINSFLQTLENQWKDFFDRRRTERVPRVFVAYETRASLGVAVVPQLYAETSHDGRAYPVSADHTSIVKPANRSALIYSWLNARIREASEIHMSVPFKKWELGQNQVPLGRLLMLFSSPTARKDGFNVKIVGDAPAIEEVGRVSITGSYAGATWADVLERISEKNDCIGVVPNRNRREVTLSKTGEVIQCSDRRFVCSKIAC